MTTPIQAGAIHIACEEIDHTWHESQITEFWRLWKEGFTLVQIAKYFRRPIKEIVVLAVDVFDKRQLPELLSDRYMGEESKGG